MARVAWLWVCRPLLQAERPRRAPASAVGVVLIFNDSATDKPSWAWGGHVRFLHTLRKMVHELANQLGSAPPVAWLCKQNAHSIACAALTV